MDYETFAGFAKDFWGIWLMLLFLGAVVWALWPSKKRQKFMDESAMIPFKEDDDASGPGNGPKAASGG